MSDKMKQPTDRDADPAKVDTPDRGVPPGADQEKPTGLPDSGRHESETAPVKK